MKQKYFTLVITDDELSTEGKGVDPEKLEMKHFNVDHWDKKDAAIVMYRNSKFNFLKVFKTPFSKSSKIFKQSK